MKKLMFYAALLLCLVVMPVGVQAYTVDDPAHDSIAAPGETRFESYGINVLNYYNGPMTYELFTNYPQNGVSVGGWNTTPADLFIYEIYKGNPFTWAIPLVSRTGFTAGTMYAVGSYLVSDDLDPSHGTGFIYNHNIPVQIATIGNNYGFGSFAGGTVNWDPLVPGSPDYKITIRPDGGNGLGLYQDDPNGTTSFIWGTATCANDVVGVPEPMTMLLLGLGLVGLAGFRRKFKS